MKKIIELTKILNMLNPDPDGERNVWTVKMIVYDGSEYAQEIYTRKCDMQKNYDENIGLWQAFYRFIPENRKNYNELTRAFKKYGFEVEKKACGTPYPNYWESDPPFDYYLIYASKEVY